MDQLDTISLIIRFWLAVIIIFHGVNHARSLEGTANWFASKGFKNAPLNAKLSAFAEIGIGAAIIAGFLTSFAVAGLVATMFVAFWTIHRFAGFFNFHRPDEGYEYVATVAIMGLLLAIIGPGAVSVDDALGWADSLDGWVGALIAGGGLLAGYAQTLVFWEKPEEKEQTS